MDVYQIFPVQGPIKSVFQLTWLHLTPGMNEYLQYPHQALGMLDHNHDLK